MFREEYRKAYDRISPGKDSVNKILMEVRERLQKNSLEENAVEQSCLARSGESIFRILRPVAVVSLALCLLGVFVPSAAAKHFGSVYGIIEKYVPALAEFILPEEISSTSKGITMQVEAIDIVDNTAEILLSFRDAQNSEKDIIKGRVDLYDSFHLDNFGAQWQAGGAGFLEYDETEDKAYYKVQLTASDAYSKSKVRLGVTQLLTEATEEERAIDMSDMLTDPAEKVVSLSGKGGKLGREELLFFEKSGSTGNPGISDASGTPDAPDDPRPVCRVMDLVKSEAGLVENLAESLTITGVAYDEGVLRVQSCRGNFSNADRHIRPYLKDTAGNERITDASVSWQEEINGERVLFDEHWFLLSEEELENYDLYGMFYISGGSVKGDWEVTFRLN